MSNDTMMQNNEKIWKDDKRYFKKVWNLSCCRMYRKHEGINGRLREHYQEVREKHSEAFVKSIGLKK